jgi:hypothetical protein
MSTLEMYEHNLSTNKQLVSRIAQRIVALSEGRDTPWDWNELLADMETAISKTLRSRLALSVAKDLHTKPQPEEPEEEPPALEENCATCGTNLHHTLGEFGVDGDDVEIPTWRRVYDPVCEEMEVDSGSMVCRECLENGSDFEHSVDCYSDGEEAAD